MSTEKTCNCRWDGDTQVQQCTLHQAHVDAIHEWADRARGAEEERDALAARLAELQGQEPIGEVTHSDVLPNAEEKYRHEFVSDFRIGVQAELYARPVPAAEPVNARLLALLREVLALHPEWSAVRDAIAAAESATAEPLISPAANESVNQRLLEALEELVSEFGVCGLTEKARAAIAAAEAAPVAPQPDAEGWINPNDKARKQYLPHIGERVLFCHAGITYYGKHTGGSFQSFSPPRTFGTWDCLWMYPPKALEAQP